MAKHKYDYHKFYPSLSKAEALEAAEEYRKLAVKRFRSAKKGQLMMDEFREAKKYLKPLKDGNYNQARNRIAKLQAFLRSEVSTRKGYEEYVRRGSKVIDAALGIHLLSGYPEESFNAQAAGRIIADFEEEIKTRVLSSNLPSDAGPTGKGAAVRMLIEQAKRERGDLVEVQTVQVAPGVYRDVKKLSSSKPYRLDYINELLEKWKVMYGVK